MIRVRQVKVNINNDNKEGLTKKLASILHLKQTDILNYAINKKAIDARDKNNIIYVYELDVLIKNEELFLKKNKNKDVFLKEEEEYKLPIKGKEKLKKRIIIVGSGPAGLFAAYLLAENGYRPLIIERGKRVEERIKDVENFWTKGVLEEDSNVQFGEGGAGTFSDGKLNTLVKDKRHLGKLVLEVLVKQGAPEEILYEHNPHIGTDILRKVVVNMRNYILENGGEINYQTKLTDLVIEDGELKGIIINQKEKILCDALVLAIGHSARDTFKMLNDRNVLMEAKAFAVGFRVMHDQKLINEAQYGKEAAKLPPASYKLTYTTSKNRGVYSFCMCPGGYVVNASSEKGRLAINGMSNYKRDSGMANSAIIVTINKDDFKDDVFAGLEFQRKLEEKAYKIGGGDIPLQLWGDYKINRPSVNLGKLKPMIKGKYKLGNLREIMPDYINEAIMEAMPSFGLKIKGFDDDSVLMAGVESRTSSPVRIIRDEKLEANIKNLYPCGEGAGYAGGITTSAIDGIKVAEEIIKKYQSY